jgi:hypothetical protein
MWMFAARTSRTGKLPPPEPLPAAIEARFAELEQRIAMIERIHVLAVEQARLNTLLHPSTPDPSTEKH